MKRKKILVGMSGGVDSSVAAYLLKKQGHEVCGITMKIWGGSSSGDFAKSGCYGPGEARDIEDAKKAAGLIGIRHYTAELNEEYKSIVLGYFSQEYLAGKTPNPCVICNQRIKFGLLLEKAAQMGAEFDFFATGHYAQTGFSKSANRYFLKKGAGDGKDQSYFLYGLKQGQLSKIMFPLGSYKKAEIKKIAVKIGLGEFAVKPESQDFYEGEDYSAFFREGEVSPGNIVDKIGRVLGRHKGIVHYTIGQRRGLNLGGLSEPYYVAGIDACKNLIIAGPKEDLYSKGLIAGDVNWVSAGPAVKPFGALAKIRLQHTAQKCEVFPIGMDKIKVIFDQPQISVTPGQSAVVYARGKVLCGGVIERNFSKENR